MGGHIRPQYMEKEVENAIRKDMAERKILKGTVIQYRTYRALDNVVNEELVVQSAYGDVIITRSEATNYLFSRTYAALVGELVRFVITDVYPDEDAIFGSMREADKIRQAPTLSRLYKGQPLIGNIVHFTKFGAYIDLGNGVQGFLRNSDYSASGGRISDDYTAYSPIKVVYSHTTVNGTIIFLPKDIKNETSDINARLKKGELVPGEVKDVFVNRVYVRVSKNIDALCPFPAEIAYLAPGDIVTVRLTQVKVREDKGLRVRGEIAGLVRSGHSKKRNTKK